MSHQILSETFYRRNGKQNHVPTRIHKYLSFELFHSDDFIDSNFIFRKIKSVSLIIIIYFLNSTQLRLIGIEAEIQSKLMICRMILICQV